MARTTLRGLASSSRVGTLGTRAQRPSLSGKDQIRHQIKNMSPIVFFIQGTPCDLPPVAIQRHSLQPLLHLLRPVLGRPPQHCPVRRPGRPHHAHRLLGLHPQPHLLPLGCLRHHVHRAWCPWLHGLLGNQSRRNLNDKPDHEHRLLCGLCSAHLLQLHGQRGKP